MNGNKVFKAKGARAAQREFTYEDLQRLMLSICKLVFEHQIAFKRIPRVQGSGVSVEEGLVKTY